MTNNHDITSMLQSWIGAFCTVDSATMLTFWPQDYVDIVYQSEENARVLTTYAEIKTYWEEQIPASLEGIAKIEDTGEKFDTSTIYDVTFDVVSDTAPPFQVVHRQMISATALGNWQPGKTLPVRFDPANTSQITIG